MSSDPENEYFSDGITEELLNVLAREPGLQVTARTSSFAFKGRNEDIKQIGAQLGAKTILEGSVRKAGNRIRITAQLISAVDGYHIWSETYDRLLEDIFELQDEIAHKITNRLREKLTLESEEVTLLKPPTTNIEAYNIYLKGLFHANKFTQEGMEVAMNELHKAIDMEPDFALPYSRMSYIYTYLGTTGMRPLQEVYPKAKEFAQKAIQLNERAAESHEALANVYLFYEWKWDEAYRSLEKAIKLNPSYAAAFFHMAMWFIIHANIEEAIETMRKSIQLDPFNPAGNYAYAAILFFSGRIKECSDQLDKLFEISPHLPIALGLKGMVYQEMGEYEKAMDLFNKAQKIPGFEISAYGYLGSLFLIMNQPAKAEECLEKLLSAEKEASGQNIAFAIASIYAGMDKPDEMYHYLKKSADNKDFSVMYILVYPVFKKYHQDSRFAEIVKKIGLWK